LKAEDVSFLSTAGISLKGWYIRAKGTVRGTLIVTHGINGNRSDMVSRGAFLVRDGYNTLLVKPTYYLRTHVWLEGKKADALVAISGMGTRPILFVSGREGWNLPCAECQEDVRLGAQS